ncbi:SPX and EXS domain-containing protein 5 isoform X2 [Brassica rapa]|uniref:SPX and EXS domain-containing protein 5 isoform X2 n=1 Tax=Brassica campestris TaxID=3711 RepID=UPI00142D379E|nr:SPX and EXS domain-containing protein 5 isoform X2 [Brassica rapa]
MFGGVFSVPVNNPHLRKSGRENDLKNSSMQLGTIAKLRSPLLLSSLKVALYVGGLYVCGKIGWESVMKMGQDTRELFFYETFLYYNPLLLITMMVWLWGVNLWVFSRTGVDYAAIFYLGPDHLSHKEIWKCARWMTTIILTSMTAYLYLYSHGDVSLAASQPIVLYLSAVIILIIPFDIFYMSSRYYLLWTFWRILFPVQTVSFSDFFLADILTSLSKVTQTFYNIYDVLNPVSEQDKVYAQVLSDLERSVCRMVHRQVATVAWFEADSVCGSHSAVIPLVLVLPYLFRLFQCIRQYKDSKDIANIWNAGKYLTAVPVIFLSALKYFIDQDTWTYSIQPAWILSGLANTFFSFFWDVLRDWDLSVFTRIFKFTKPNLCSHLLYGRRWVYVWVIGSNLVLRWTWTYKLSAHLRNNYITVFIITLLEIYRRFQWAFFRIENVWYKINNPKRTTSHQTNPVSLQNDNGGEQEKLLAHSHSLGV